MSDNIAMIRRRFCLRSRQCRATKIFLEIYLSKLLIILLFFSLVSNRVVIFRSLLFFFTVGNMENCFVRF